MLMVAAFPVHATIVALLVALTSLQSMPHRHSPAAAAIRLQRAIDRKYVVPKKPNESFVSVLSEAAPRLKVMARGPEAVKALAERVGAHRRKNADLATVAAPWWVARCWASSTPWCVLQMPPNIGRGFCPLTQKKEKRQKKW